MANQKILQSLLLNWSKAEPSRCKQIEEDSFVVLYLGEWLPASSKTNTHGNIIVSVLEGCQENAIYCEIEFTPRYEDDPATLQVGCIHKMFRYREGEAIINSVPELLLTEYLERFTDRE
jgi:hypothetical protein